MNEAIVEIAAETAVQTVVVVIVGNAGRLSALPNTVVASLVSAVNALSEEAIVANALIAKIAKFPARIDRQSKPLFRIASKPVLARSA